MNNQWFSKVAVWMVIALVLFTVFKQFDRGAAQGSQIAYSDFLEEVRNKRVKAVTLQEGPAGTEIVNQAAATFQPPTPGEAGQALSTLDFEYSSTTTAPLTMGAAPAAWKPHIRGVRVAGPSAAYSR